LKTGCYYSGFSAIRQEGNSQDTNIFCSPWKKLLDFLAAQGKNKIFAILFYGEMLQ
jgi:hypothetical protein